MKIKLLDFGYTNAPNRAHYNDAGADIYSPIDIGIDPGETVKIPLGFGLEIPDGYYGIIFGRSSTYAKGLTMGLPPIDSGYRGEIHAVVTNTSNRRYIINKQDRIGQLVIMPVILADFVEDLENNRGTGAFGSTGK